MKKIAHLFILSIALLFIFPAGGFSQSMNSQEDISDTLRIVRKGLVTRLYLKEERMSYNDLMDLYRATPQGVEALKWSQPLRIAGPVVALGGIALGGVALKGEQRWTTVEGSDYHYTARSKVKLGAGLLLLAGGLCLFEFSNDLVARSAKAYNKAYVAKKLMSNTRIEVTPDGGIGLVARF